MKKRKRTFRRGVDIQIRRHCRKLTEKQRKVVVGTAFILFLIGCLYTIATSLSGFGTPDTRYKIEHIRSLEQMLDKDTNDKNINLNDYHDDGHPENQEMSGAFSQQTADAGREA